jgi:nucleoside-diphosphate-sugar epimerase
VGVGVAAFLAGCGFEVAGLDLAGGLDVLDLAAVGRAVRGCATVVHLAALAHDGAGSPERIMAVSVLGTWRVLPDGRGGRCGPGDLLFQRAGVRDRRGRAAAGLRPGR